MPTHAQTRPRQEFRAFADAAPHKTQAQEFNLEAWAWDRIDFRVQPGGILSYLAGARIEVDDGTLKRFELCGANGLPLVYLSGRSVELLRYDFRFELDERGTGCLANLSAASPYMVRMQGDARGRIVWTGRPLPSQQDIYGKPQAVTPPHPGTFAMWSEITHLIAPAGEDREVEMRRCGNLIRDLYVVHRREDGSPVDGKVRLTWDDILVERGLLKGYDGRMIEVEVDRIEPGVTRFSARPGLPTTIQSRVRALLPDADESTLVDFIVHDVNIDYR